MEKFKQFLNTDPKLRTFTAIIMFAVVFAAYKIGFWGINGLIIAITSAMIYEYDKMFDKKLGLSFIIDEFVIIGTLFYFLFTKSYNYSVLVVLSLYFCLKLIINAILNKKHWVLASLQPIYIGLGVLSIVFLYNISLGGLIYAFVITITTDTFAFFIGMKLQGPKLCPKISPKKTISGAVGGWISSFIISTAIILYINHKPGSRFIILISIVNLILPIISQLGDLFESYIKRLNNVKDTSQILPGHGGLLDRFDSILFVAPIIALLVNILIYIMFSTLGFF